MSDRPLHHHKLSEQERQNVTNGEPENAVLERYKRKRVSRLIEPGIFCAPQARRFLMHDGIQIGAPARQDFVTPGNGNRPHTLTHSHTLHSLILSIEG